MKAPADVFFRVSPLWGSEQLNTRKHERNHKPPLPPHPPAHPAKPGAAMGTSKVTALSLRTPGPSWGWHPATACELAVYTLEYQQRVDVEENPTPRREECEPGLCAR